MCKDPGGCAAKAFDDKRGPTHSVHLSPRRPEVAASGLRPGGTKGGML